MHREYLSIPQGPIQSQLWDKQPKTFWTFNSAKSNSETLAPGRYLRRLRFQFRKVQFRAAGRISSTTVPRPFNSARSNSECLLCTLSLALGVLSIPQGPIQSVNFNNTTLKSEDFQFRKVQFRAPRANFVALTHPTFNSARSNSEHLRPRSNIATIQLSIPQGPIQSDEARQIASFYQNFQFRKVQFRGVSRCAMPSVRSTFNSARSNSEPKYSTVLGAVYMLSIPQGPIQRATPTRPGRTLLRLSIPQGPIQSPSRHDVPILYLRFQFRKVQFRGAPATSWTRASSDFQFRKVQFRAVSGSTRRQQASAFNSARSNSEFHRQVRPGAFTAFNSARSNSELSCVISIGATTGLSIPQGPIQRRADRRVSDFATAFNSARSNSERRTWLETPD